jgi:hypothetical protein
MVERRVVQSPGCSFPILLSRTLLKSQSLRAASRPSLDLTTVKETGPISRPLCKRARG